MGNRQSRGSSSRNRQLGIAIGSGINITQYWSPDRIKNAKLKDRLSPVGVEAAGLIHGMRGDQTLTEVPDDVRETFPYQSVGLLMFKHGGENYTGSAFVAKIKGAKNIIFTTAHNLSDAYGESSHILFIPGQTSDGDEPYKRFEQIEGGKGEAWFVLPEWVPDDAPMSLDIGAVKVKKNSDGKDVGELVYSTT